MKAEHTTSIDLASFFLLYFLLPFYNPQFFLKSSVDLISNAVCTAWTMSIFVIAILFTALVSGNGKENGTI
jgi:hypothetical protein